MIICVAVPAPVRHTFDYLAPEGTSESDLVPGMRVRVPFRGGARIGVVMARTEKSHVAPEKLKPIVEVLDAHPVLPGETLDLLAWTSSYYHHPIGEVLFRSLPALLRRGRSARVRGPSTWRLTPEGAGVSLEALARSPRQAALLAQLRARPDGLKREDFEAEDKGWSTGLQALAKKGWVERTQGNCLERDAVEPLDEFVPDPAQSKAIDAITSARNSFQAFLLDGVTGSGKTEVYLDVIASVVKEGRQALILVPEIGLTPQTVARFRRRLPSSLAVLHSGLTDRERLCAWLMARDGEAAVIIGTRSSVFVPLKNPGVFVVDEEHDLAYKQQEGLRYSARDVAVMRARRWHVPIILGSATPSLESLSNVRQGRYRHLELRQRAKGVAKPAVSLIDVRRQRLDDSLSQPMLDAIANRLNAGEQTLLFLNRRGYAPVMMCHACGWVADCARCDAHMVYHRGVEKLRCHHCGAEKPVVRPCAQCGSVDMRTLGTGTQRVGQALSERFPDARIVRADRDIASRKGALEAVFSRIHNDDVDIVVGTQMVAKGHHFPRVTLVGILDADGGLFGADFRASERMAQLVVQVAGRAGRGERPGQVLVQTHHPDHPLLAALISQGYEGCARAALAERAEAGLPPCAWMALLRAESPKKGSSWDFLEQAKGAAQPMCNQGIALLGPVASPMERRAGRYRAQLLVESRERGALHRFLNPWISAVESLKAARRVRWSVDVDPQEML